KNDWVDRHGNVYCLYSRENLADDINVSVNTIRKCINKLTELNLMKEIRKGQGKPNFMYISKVESTSSLRGSKVEHQDNKNLNPSDTDLSDTEKIKRYTITSNVVGLLNYYNFKYIQTLDKEHHTVTEEQLNYIEQTVYDIQIDLDIHYYDIERYIDYHFDNLPKNNDCKIFYFIGDGYMSSPILRYRDYV